VPDINDLFYYKLFSNGKHLLTLALGALKRSFLWFIHGNMEETIAINYKGRLLSISDTSESAVEALSFDDFCELLIPLGALNSPAELHGVLCGKLCGGASVSISEWQAAAWDLLDVAGEPDAQAHEYVSRLYTITQSQLTSGEYDLQPFLPDDDSDLEQRTQALSQWCHGFLSGFGSAGIDPNAEFSTDQADALRDMAAIVQVTIDGDLEGEEGRGEDQQEADFTELVEYVRVIAMNFYEDKLQSSDDKGKRKPESKDSSQTVH
jgi:uncharacterized protein YgfB (UPF0149 family)